MMLSAAAIVDPAGWTQNLPAVLMILVFLVMTGLMYARRISALLALPLMALGFAVVGLVRVGDFVEVLRSKVGPDGAAVFLATAGAWVAVAAGVIWLRRRRKIASKPAWIAGFLATVVAFIIIQSDLAMLAAKGALGQLLGCLEAKTILDEIVHKGALRLYEPYTIAFFGGMLAIYIREKRLAETLIKYAAELGGDRPAILAMVMMLVSMALFTTLGGLGAIIMVGTIILPIMLSLGLSPFVAAGVFLIGVCAGGSLNPTGWALYRDTLQVETGMIQQFALLLAILYILTGGVFVFLSTRGKWRRRRWTWAATPALESPELKKVRPLALLSPIIPIFLVFRLSAFAEMFLYLRNATLFVAIEAAFVGGAAAIGLCIGILPRFTRPRTPQPSIGWIVAGVVLALAQAALFLGPASWMTSVHAGTLDFLDGFRRLAEFWDRYIGGWSFIPAFMAGILFCLVTTWDSKGNNLQVLTKSVIEGAESVMPAVLLMCGIGMLLQAVQNPQISGYLKPLIAAVTPQPGPLYVIGFGLAAPLALYRGPLNVWGLGLGIAAVMMATGRLTGPLLMAMFMSVGAVQGVCDPTNTHNVWIANFLGEDVLAITRYLLPFIWAMVFVGLIVASFLFRLPVL